MRDNALYFPYISVPNEAWTIKTLLYWDKLSSIVPMDYIDSPEQLDPFMQQLVHDGLVNQIFPAQYLYQVTSFEECFIRLMERKINLSQQLPSRGLRQDRRRLRLHIEKLGNIPEFLEEHDLATRIDWSWYDVDERTANLFMAYLATCLGAIPEINAAPVTNKVVFASMYGNVNRARHNEGSVHHRKARDVILHSLLPTPGESVTLHQLLSFKEKHGHLLPALRRKVESHCAIIALLQNSEDREAATIDFIDQCKIEVDEIVDAMKPTWRNITFGSLTPLFGSGLAWQTTETGNHLAYAGAALSFAGTAYQAIASIRGDREVQLSKPLAYIAHARGQMFA